MPDNEDQFDPEDIGARSGERGGESRIDINFLPTDPVHLGQRARRASNAAIHVTVHNNALLPTSLPGQHSEVLRDAFADAIRFYTEDDEVKALLQALASKQRLRFEVSTNFSRTIPSDDSIAKQLAFSISYLRLPEWEKIQADAISHQACWVTGYGGTTSDFLNFEYCLAVCHDVSTMEELVRKYQEVQQERERIDAERDQWLHREAEPFMETLREMLSDATLPEVNREELQKMFQELRGDAYYRGVISTAEAAKILDRTEQIARRHARKGTVGFDTGQRNYVFNELDVEAFSRLDRPPGGDQTKKPKS